MQPSVLYYSSCACACVHCLVSVKFCASQRRTQAIGYYPHVLHAVEPLDRQHNTSIRRQCVLMCPAYAVRGRVPVATNVTLRRSVSPRSARRRLYDLTEGRAERRTASGLSWTPTRRRFCTWRARQCVSTSVTRSNKTRRQRGFVWGGPTFELFRTRTRRRRKHAGARERWELEVTGTARRATWNTSTPGTAWRVVSQGVTVQRVGTPVMRSPGGKSWRSGRTGGGGRIPSRAIVARWSLRLVDRDQRRRRRDRKRGDRRDVCTCDRVWPGGETGCTRVLSQWRVTVVGRPRPTVGRGTGAGRGSCDSGPFVVTAGPRTVGNRRAKIVVRRTGVTRAVDSAHTDSGWGPTVLFVVSRQKVNAPRDLFMKIRELLLVGISIPTTAETDYSVPTLAGRF